MSESDAAIEVLSVLDFEKFLEGTEEQIGGASHVFLLACFVDLEPDSAHEACFVHAQALEGSRYGVLELMISQALMCSTGMASGSSATYISIF